VDASREIQIDRYSAKSPVGVEISFLDEGNPHAGWKTSLTGAKAWVRFNDVDFGDGKEHSFAVRAKAPGKTRLEIHVTDPQGPLLGRVTIEPGLDWKIVSAKANHISPGVHDLVLTQAGEETVQVDWISFR